MAPDPAGCAPSSRCSSCSPSCVPLVLLALGRPEASAPLLLAAFGVQYVGLLAERWFFFAQARHPQNLYYQAVS